MPPDAKLRNRESLAGTEPAHERKTRGRRRYGKREERERGVESRRKGERKLPERKVRFERKKNEIDRGRREMEASGSTPPSARVFRKFDKSCPHTSVLLHPPIPLLLLVYLSASSTARASDEISSSSQSLVIPRVFWAGTRYTIYPELSSSKVPIVIPLAPPDLDPQFASSAPFASLHEHSRTTYFAAHLRESVVGHRWS